jgi:hypothetical protein
VRTVDDPQLVFWHRRWAAPFMRDRSIESLFDAVRSRAAGRLAFEAQRLRESRAMLAAVARGRDAIAGPTAASSAFHARDWAESQHAHWVRQVAEDEVFLELAIRGIEREVVYAIDRRFHAGLASIVGPPWGPAMTLGEARRDPAVAEAVKLGNGSRFGRPPTAEEWNMTPDEARRSHGRLSRLARWEIIGDHAAALYALIAPRAIVERQRLEDRYTAVMFKRDALELTAGRINAFYGTALAWRDVATRLQTRGLRGASRGRPPNN